MNRRAGFAPILLLIIAAFVGAGLFVYHKQATRAPVVSETQTALSVIENATYAITGDGITTAAAHFSHGSFHPEKNIATSDGGLNSEISSYALGDINQDHKQDAVVVTTSGMGVRDARVDELHLVLDVIGDTRVLNLTLPRIIGQGSIGRIEAVSVSSTGLVLLYVYTYPANSSYATIKNVKTYKFDGHSLIDTGN